MKNYLREWLDAFRTVDWKAIRLDLGLLHIDSLAEMKS